MAAPIRGTHSDDVLHGHHGDDTIFGRSGDDILFGHSGDDALYGGRGDDVLHGGSGDDFLSGGRGDDVLDGGSGDDVLKGGAGDDQLSGGSGDDQLFGGSGDDQLSGGSGDDELHGGSGDDVLKGGSGDDLLDGGSGDNVLTGGSGDDTFRFSDVSGNTVITDLGGDDKIDLTALSNITDVSQLTITQVGKDTVITFHNGGASSLLAGSSDEGGSITVKNATPDEVISHLEVACVMRGTLVRTPAGERAVETLGIGDEVLTVDGSAERIKWIGKRSYARPFLAHGGKVAPILFKAGAIGPNQPARDLYVSPEHAMYVDNVLVPAKLLVNGTSIRQVATFDMVEYFHLEFDEPEVILTNAAPSESYVDDGNRRMFANYAEYVELYGETVPAEERRRRFFMIGDGAALSAIRHRLEAESAAA